MTRAPLTRRQGWVLAVMATLTMTVSILDRSTIQILAPTVTKDLAIDEQTWGLLNSAFAAAYLVSAPFAGKLLERWGARRGLFWAVIVWSSVAALHALAPTVGVLILLRVMLGVAESPSYPGASQTVQRALGVRDRPRAFGLLLVGSALAGVIAPPLATALNSRYGWRVALLGSSAIALSVWVPLWRLIAFTPQARQALDAEGEGERDGGARPVEGPGFGTLLRHAAVLRMFAAMASGAPAVAFWSAWGAKFLVAHFSVPQASVGAYLWVPPVFTDIGMLLFGDLASRRASARRDGSQHRSLFLAALALSVVQVGIPFMPTPALGNGLLAVSSLGLGGYVSLLSSETFARVPAASVARVGGLFATAQSVCFIVYYTVIGRMVQGYGRYTEVVVAVGCMLLPGGLFFALHRAPPVVESHVATEPR